MSKRKKFWIGLIAFGISFFIWMPIVISFSTVVRDYSENYAWALIIIASSLVLIGAVGLSFVKIKERNEQNPIKHEPTCWLNEAINKLKDSPKGSTITINNPSPDRKDDFKQYLEENGLKVDIESSITLKAKPGTYEYKVTLI